MTGKYRHVVYPTACAVIVIDGVPIELTPDDPRWKEYGLDRLSQRIQENLEKSIEETKK